MTENQDQKLAADKAWQEHLNRKKENADAITRRNDRLWLAGMAMQALIAKGGGYRTDIAHQSWQMADTMLGAENG